MAEAPAAAAGPQVSPFLGSLPLPYYARPDYAFQRFDRLTNPGPQAARVFVVPADFILFVQTASCSFTASAAAGNRTPTMVVQDQDGNTIFQIFSTISSGPSASQTMFWMANLTAVITIGTTVYMPLPPVILPPGYRLRWDFTSGQAGDQLSGITTLGTAIPTGIVDRGSPGDVAPPPYDSAPIPEEPPAGEAPGPGGGDGGAPPEGPPAAVPPLEHVAEPQPPPAGAPPPAAIPALPHTPPPPPPPPPGPPGVPYVPGPGHPGPTER